MKKILAFAGSNSSTSINQQLLDNVLGRIRSHEIKEINLTDYPLPIFSEDIEKNEGFPINATIIKNLILENDALIISVNEHNGGPSAFFKNIIDWLSRINKNFLEDKKILLMSTSPGKRGAQSSLEYTRNIFGRFGGEVVESFSFPSFKDNFDDGKVINEVLDMGIEDVLTTFAHQIEN
ncbi:NADPH-dependent FMN reductase [Christiangramia sabulilitoris]|uniref:NAD(P)H-dependent oxidoreductase n=1 Tax=Christiangramia sabulilitoris TaxID=2583991 RepID=A0A550I2L4_9FLAO|nr:NAD(P)H-dependent oxidoreductase [Christiangramia sabulilitoris]TRO65224.1 NAD(P)H-dependent oxidoreductase [Christiangramia sabulilitoris]